LNTEYNRTAIRIDANGWMDESTHNAYQPVSKRVHRQGLSSFYIHGRTHARRKVKHLVGVAVNFDDADVSMRSFC
jgi:hypothetical protein